MPSPTCSKVRKPPDAQNGRANGKIHAVPAVHKTHAAKGRLCEMCTCSGAKNGCGGAFASGAQAAPVLRSCGTVFALDRFVPDHIHRQREVHIYSVKTVDQGIPLLTGREAGVQRDDGTYPKGTVNRAVHDWLRDLAEKGKSLFKPDGAAPPEPQDTQSLPCPHNERSPA